MPEYKVRLVQTFEGTIEAPTEELVPEHFTDLMYDPIQPHERWEITQVTYSDE